uniref:FLYWCH-type domain-containing protein n=2 Tax=Cacopsylla melanoneura TaxID=428564 RepID=A0A8D9EYD5_9HEMI
MDNFKVEQVNGRYKLLFEDYSFRYSNLIGNTGYRWNCELKTCPAHVHTNRDKSLITGGDYLHNHEKETTTSPKSPRSTPLTSRRDKSVGSKIIVTSTPKPPTTGTQSTVAEKSSFLDQHSSDPDKRTSLLEERNAAITTIMNKEQENEQLQVQITALKAELSEAETLITNLRQSLKSTEDAWAADKKELAKLRKPDNIPTVAISSSSNSSSNNGSQDSTFSSNPKTKLTIIGDSHVHNLLPVLCKLFPPSFDIKCHAKSGSGTGDVSSVTVREHGAQDWVFVFAGTNDICKKSWSNIEASLAEIIIKFSGSKLVFILVPPRRKSTEFNGHIHALNVKISTFLDKKNVMYVNPALVLNNNNYNRDGLHLNRVGKRTLCQMLKSHVLENKLFKTLTKPSHTSSESVPPQPITSNKTNNHKQNNSNHKQSNMHDNKHKKNTQTQHTYSHRAGPTNRYPHTQSGDNYQSHVRRGNSGRSNKKQYNSRIFESRSYPHPGIPGYHPSACCSCAHSNHSYYNYPYQYPPPTHYDDYGPYESYDHYYDSNPHFLNLRR